MNSRHRARGKSHVETFHCSLDVTEYNDTDGHYRAFQHLKTRDIAVELGFVVVEFLSVLGNRSGFEVFLVKLGPAGWWSAGLSDQWVAPSSIRAFLGSTSRALSVVVVRTRCTGKPVLSRCLEYSPARGLNISRILRVFRGPYRRE